MWGLAQNIIKVLVYVRKSIQDSYNTIWIIARDLYKYTFNTVWDQAHSVSME